MPRIWPRGASSSSTTSSRGADARRTFGGGLGGNLGGDYGTGWEVFEAAMRRVAPEGRFVDLDASHPIFHAFFEVNRLEMLRRPTSRASRSSAAYSRNNDPRQRLQIIVDCNTDVSQFWEWSGTGLRPIDETNEAYKLGVNYIIYGMTH